MRGRSGGAASRSGPLAGAHVHARCHGQHGRDSLACDATESANYMALLRSPGNREHLAGRRHDTSAAGAPRLVTALKSQSSHYILQPRAMAHEQLQQPHLKPLGPGVVPWQPRLLICRQVHEDVLQQQYQLFFTPAGPWSQVHGSAWLHWGHFVLD